MNMNKNKKIGFFVVLLILSGIVFISVYKRANNGYSAFMALGCTAEEYNEVAGVGYLTLVVDTPIGLVTKRIKVEDADIKTSLSAMDLKEVLGVNMTLYLPKQYISENHLNVEATSPFELLVLSNTYDDFFSIIDVSVKTK